MTMTFEDMISHIDSEDTKKKASDAASGKREYTPDPTLFQLTLDKAGNGQAVIRFLPTTSKDALAWVKTRRFSFQKNGKWYSENDRSIIGLNDPCANLYREYYSKARETGGEKDQNNPWVMKARGLNRKTIYYANILVVKDTGNPENEGKVFKYRFGAQIFNKINAKCFPSAEDIESGVEPIDIFHPFNGANFRLKQKMKDKYPNYDDSEFLAPSALDKKKAEAAWKACYDLSAIIAVDQFKSEEDLQKKLDFVLGSEVVTTNIESKLEREEFDEGVKPKSNKKNVKEEEDDDFTLDNLELDDEIPF